MSIAYKCDRCGKCYDPTEFPEELFLSLRGGFVTKGSSFKDPGPLGQPFKEEIRLRDFCNDCTTIVLKELNKQGEIKNEKESKAIDAAINDFHTSLNDFLKKVGSRGTAILREYVYGNSDSKTPKRKSDPEQESKG